MNIEKKSKSLLYAIVTLSSILIFFLLLKGTETSYAFADDEQYGTAIVKSPGSFSPDALDSSPDTPVQTSKPFRRNRRFVILVPANTPSPNLCKLFLSAIALGYPSPVVVNWGLDWHDVSKWERGKNLLKIPGVMRYLDHITREDAHPDDKLEEDDIVMIVDGFDVWFQLPPEVLLKRYHDINKRAEARLRHQWGGEGPMPMKQTIVASSQKKCYPGPKSHMDLHCDDLPQSPLRRDLYGPHTDQNLPDAQHHDDRPRWINGGSYIGPAGDLQRMFRRVVSKLDAGIGAGVKLYSEQGVSGEILGEQEIWRRWRREQNELSVLEDEEATALMERDFEYHIGLDYAQELTVPTVFAENDGLIIPLSNQTRINRYSEALGIHPPRLHGVPSDIQATRNPLSMIKKGIEWEDMPLYADFFTTTIPVAIHHNAYKDNLKQRRIWWWDRTWYFPHLRRLLDHRLTPGELTPLARVDTEEGQVTYWAPDSDRKKRKPRMMNETATEGLKEGLWNTLCAISKEDKEEFAHENWWDEVFRDGKGPLPR